MLVISYKNIALQILFYSSQADYNCYRVIANFVPNFVGIATGINQKKAIGSVRSPISETPFPPINLNKKNLEKIFYGSRVTVKFVSNFIAMATGVNW